MSQSTLAKEVRLAQLARAFTPEAPINNADLFAGRSDQIMACVDLFWRRGAHIALCGERGVGKTSLASVLPKIFSSPSLPSMDAVRVDCNTNDDYNSIWRKVFRALRLDAEFIDNSVGFVDPDEIRFELARLGKSVLIVLDEFDRVENDDALSLLADTVKTLSDDHAAEVTLMFVGVAESVDALLGEHESIGRNVKEVPMPRMSTLELEKVLTTCCGLVDCLSITNAARDRVVRDSEGLPHFVHLLGLYGGKRCVNDDRDVIDENDIAAAEAEGTENHIMAAAHRRATSSPQPDHRFVEVLLACAYARKGELGYFRPGDVREPLSIICGQPMGIQTFQRHLREFSETRMTLERVGPDRRHEYRFRDPLLQPFIKIVARAKGSLDAEVREALERHQQGSARLTPEPPTEPGQLFSLGEPDATSSV